MGFNCNIDAKGRAIRLINGAVIFVIGLVLLFTWAWRGGSLLAWAVSGVLILSGAFSIFEGRAGWCVVRAMGFKTRF